MSITTADGDVRYVPEEWAPHGFCAIAHETRYSWFLEKFDVRGKTVLDFGCGSGYGARRISELADSVTAVDISTQAISYAKQKYGKPNLQFLEADLCDLGITKNISTKFDLILSFDVIEHVEHYYNFVKNIALLLNDDGVAVIGCPNRWATFDYNVDWNLNHMQEFTPAQLHWLVNMFFSEVDIYSQDFGDAELRAKYMVQNTKNSFSTLYLVKELIRGLTPAAFHSFVRSIKSSFNRFKINPSKNTRVLQENDIIFKLLKSEKELSTKIPFGLISVCKLKK